MIGVVGSARCRRLADALVEVGLFEHAVGGYQIHDYLEFNATAEEALEQRERLHVDRSRSGRLGGLRSGEARRMRAEANEAKPKQGFEAKRSPIPSHPVRTRKSSALRAPRSQPVEHPDDNLGVITKLAHVAIDVLGTSSHGDLVEDVKARCAEAHIDYRSDVVQTAVDSALAQRRAVRAS